MKRAYSRLERDDTGVIRVVFYDADTSLPVDDLTGYSIVAIDNKGQAVPVNQAQPTATPQPVASADLPRMQNPPALETRSVPDVRPQGRANGGAVPGMDLEPTNRFVGPNGIMGLALGDKNIDGNTGWKNKALTTGLGMAASAAIGGPIGLAAGVVAKGIVNSDSFKNNYNSRGQLSGIGVGMGEPDVPEGAPTGEIGFGVTPTSRPTPTAQPSSAVGDSSVSEAARTATVSPSGQRSSIPESSLPAGSTVGSRYDEGSTTPEATNASLGVNTAAPSMSAFNRREPTSTPAQSSGYRQGLSPEIDAVAGIMENDFGRTLNSGYRDPGRNARVGGAKNSEHTRGNAIDVDVSNMTNEEKRSMLEAAVQNGVRGVGIYNSGRSIHLDTRQNPTSWGPRGFAGSPVSEMPEWSRDTLSAMYGAGPGGRVLPDKGPTPVSRDMGLATMAQKSPMSPEQNDLAYTSRPDFKNMSVGKIATTGFGKVPDNNTLNAMAYTIAGETVDFSPQAVANLAATLNNRINTVGPEKTFTPSQYNSLAPSARAVTDANYKKHGDMIKTAIESMYAGNNVPQNPDATHYYNPELASPAWASDLKGVYYDASHRIGNIPGEFQATKAQQAEAARVADDNFTNRSLASQVGRNVENEDKNMAGVKRGFGFNSKYDSNKSSSKTKANNSGISSRTNSGKEKDDRGVGLGSRSSNKSSTNKSTSSRSNNSGISSRSGSGKEKDDRGVGLGSKSSSASRSSSKSNAGSDKSTGPSKSSTSKSSTSSSKSGRSNAGSDKSTGSSKSSGGGKKSGGGATW